MLRKPADVRLIGSSIQLIPNGHWWEKWGNIPAERERFFELVRQTRANGVILLSGDRHLAEMVCIPSAHPDPKESVGYPLWEVTSSGLTHAGGGSDREPGPFRVSPIFSKRNFGWIGIDWAAGKLVLEIRGEDGAKERETEISISDLNW